MVERIAAIIASTRNKGRPLPSLCHKPLIELHNMLTVDWCDSHLCYGRSEAIGRLNDLGVNLWKTSEFPHRSLYQNLSCPNQ